MTALLGLFCNLSLDRDLLFECFGVALVEQFQVFVGPPYSGEVLLFLGDGHLPLGGGLRALPLVLGFLFLLGVLGTGLGLECLFQAAFKLFLGNQKRPVERPMTSNLFQSGSGMKSLFQLPVPSGFLAGLDRLGKFFLRLLRRLLRLGEHLPRHLLALGQHPVQSRLGDLLLYLQGVFEVVGVQKVELLVLGDLLQQGLPALRVGLVGNLDLGAGHVVVVLQRLLHLGPLALVGSGDVGTQFLTDELAERDGPAHQRHTTGDLPQSGHAGLRQLRPQGQRH